MHPDLTGLLDGIHFHTLCEQDSSDLETTLAAVKVKFGDLISKVKWLNLGGGHHITRPGYDIARLEKCIEAAKEEWKVDIYLEPGEAWALNAGFFLTTVLDVLQNGDTRLAILDGSAACHMPDVLEMPYRPPLLGAGGARRECRYSPSWRTNLSVRGCYRRLQLPKAFGIRRSSHVWRYGHIYNLQKQYL